MSKTEAKTDTETKDAARTGLHRNGGEEGAHTELRRAGQGPRPRARELPPEVRDEADGPDGDDPFNDVPV